MSENDSQHNSEPFWKNIKIKFKINIIFISFLISNTRKNFGKETGGSC